MNMRYDEKNIRHRHKDDNINSCQVIKFVCKVGYRNCVLQLIDISFQNTVCSPTKRDAK